ncbi:MAG: ABC transporter ATP-binding protein [Burkholderiales bacterium]|nr:ABC transporter ATP-binding protein [Burkholderiales bacterium]
MMRLEAQGLHKRYGGVDAVAGVSFSVAAAERVALIGPNGAGKTTCFNMIGGQIRPSAGRVLLDGRDVTSRPPRSLFHLGVGRTFQIATVFASMSVIENVQVALLSHRRQSLRPWSGLRDTADGARALLLRVGLDGQAGRPAAQLAYGDVKRLELALGLANEPRLLLMDEPTAGMAPTERHAFMTLVSDLARRGADGDPARAPAVLFTEHDMDVVFGHADRILVLDRGRLIAEGAPDAVRADPEVQRIYLGESHTETAT